MANFNNSSLQIDLEKYAGTWYEIARVPNSFQDNMPLTVNGILSPCFSTTAEYEITENGEIKVTNRCVRAKKGTSFQKIVKDVAIGSAKVIPNTGNAKLSVAFGPAFVQNMVHRSSPQGNYWIHSVGPEKDGKYTWSIVSDNKKENLWILSRESQISEQVKSEIIAKARDFALPVDFLTFKFIKNE